MKRYTTSASSVRHRSWFVVFLGASLACSAVSACGTSDDVDEGGPDGSAEGAAPNGDATSSADSTTVTDAPSTTDANPSDSAGAPDVNDAGAEGSDAQDDAASDSGQESGLGDDAASDSGLGDDADAAVPDAGAGCTGVDTACTLGNSQAGLCKSGVCTPCAGPSDDSACSMAYTDGGASSYVCVSGECRPGDCHASTDCSGKLCVANSCTACTTDNQCTNDTAYGTGTICSGSGTCVSDACATPNAVCPTSASHFCCNVSGATNACVMGNCCSDAQCGGGTPACISNACTACDAVTGNTWVVDPGAGSDTTTGSGNAGGAASSVCRFKTITKAIQAINAAAGVGTPPVGTKIVVYGPTAASAATGETFPLVLPQNVTLEGASNASIVFKSTTVAVSVTKAGAKIQNMQIDGVDKTGVICVDVATGGAVTIEGADIRRCGLGVRTNGAASVTVGPSTRIRENTNGMLLQQTSTTTLSSAAGQISLEQNSSSGIDVNDQAKLTIDGDAMNETIVAKQNNIGIWFHHVPGFGTLPTSEVKGFVSKQNNTSGMQINGGSAVRLRGSVLLANFYGINIPSGSIPSFENDVSRIDLGSDVAAEAGANTLQDKSVASGGTPNAGAGLCFSIQPNKSQQLTARGNKFASADATGTIDCKTATPGTAIGGAANCSNGANIAGQGRGGNVVYLDNCVE